LAQLPRDLLAVLNQQLQGNLETVEHLLREMRILSSVFLFRDPATLTGNTPLAFGYMPVSRMQVRQIVRHCEL
jgi:hypothetical protein